VCVLCESIENDFRLFCRVEKINALLSNGEINGVLDDRGRFIYVTKEQMNDLTQWMNSK
jgi:hypothetical protein